MNDLQSFLIVLLQHNENSELLFVVIRFRVRSFVMENPKTNSTSMESEKVLPVLNSSLSYCLIEFFIFYILIFNMLIHILFQPQEKQPPIMSCENIKQQVRLTPQLKIQTRSNCFSKLSKILSVHSVWQ